MDDLTNPFRTTSSEASTSQLRPKNQLITKIGQSSTSTPKTEANNRRRFGGLFATFGLSNGNGSPLRVPLGTPLKGKTSLKPTEGEIDENEEASNVNGGIWSFAERMKELTIGSPAKGKASQQDVVTGTLELGDGLMSLPDELLLQILLQLPPTIIQLNLISTISTRFYDLSRTPILWIKLFHEAGFELNEKAIKNNIAIEYPPKGQWKGSQWINSDNSSSKDDQLSESLGKLKDDDEHEDRITIHYPTLLRSRMNLQKLIQNPNFLPETTILSGHSDIVYCLYRWDNYLFTGSRDKSIRIYNLLTNNCIWLEKNVHSRSVLCINLEIDEKGKGILISGSSDSEIVIYSIDLTSQEDTMIRKKTIKETSSILSVLISSEYYISSNKDKFINIYSRRTNELIKSLKGHTQPVNSLAFSNDKMKFVSGSGDGMWKIWNINSGLVEIEGGGGRGIACVEWIDNYILTGDGDNLVKLYSSITGNLIHTFKGHTDLVRSVTINKSAKVVISSGYDKTIRMWDIHSGNLIKIINEDRSSLIFDLNMTPGKIIAAKQDGTIHVFDFDNELPYIDYFA
ncbi:uncharacterized protein I206_104968 [Kwoniella pini CBS 10737]|uniref:F-box domain-containing protein n=1 Tax=Kwoniella pini CBS 10737 TaxID=1296096 RepID=A0A1B9I8R9_9TREE|nr:uncharacterized protein I206_02507 [Kwoniella pini CBS 10737]OCF51791.1 hypothetical protein I206_02507 [Kwoniella pini CBS 10737]